MQTRFVTDDGLTALGEKEVPGLIVAGQTMMVGRMPMRVVSVEGPMRDPRHFGQIVRIVAVAKLSN